MNQKRKKWSVVRRTLRSLLTKRKVTRHAKLVRNSPTVEALIKKIKQKEYIGPYESVSIKSSDDSRSFI